MSQAQQAKNNPVDKLRDARKKAKLSGAELAARVGVTQGMISRYENGKAVPKAETRERLEAELDLGRGALLADPKPSDDHVINLLEELVQRFDDLRDVPRQLDELKELVVLQRTGDHE